MYDLVEVGTILQRICSFLQVLQHQTLAIISLGGALKEHFIKHFPDVFKG